MFHPETEDMLPRAAPKPSAPTPLEHVQSQIQPTVPEVSLLFGQQESSNKREQSCAQSQPQAPPTNYSAWKKKILPRVSFPASLATEFGSSTNVNSNTPISSSSSVSGVSSATNNKTTTTSTTNYVSSTNSYSDKRNVSPPESILYSDGLDQYRRQFENNHETYYAQRHQNHKLQRRSVDVAQLSNVREVLTICASTQTDPFCTSPPSTSPNYTVFKELATKHDLIEVHNLLHQIHEDQKRIMQYFSESLAFHQHQSQAKVKEMGTQCELPLISDNVNGVNRKTPLIHDHILDEYDDNNQELKPPDGTKRAPLHPYNRLKMTQQFQSPRAPPAAQSTAYRTNTPQTKRLPLSPANAVVNVLPKPNTEKSMVMNELALKYLPQDKLTELLQDLRLSNNNREIQEPQHYIPLRPLDISPSDISNASYKYLKKYRLLPEENINNEQQRPSPQRQAQQQQSPLCSHQPQSPFQHQQHQMLRPNSPGLLQQVDKNMLDLDNIRNQPKLL